MTKRDAFEKLWSIYDYCMMGYSKEILYKSMSKEEVLRRLKDEKSAEKNITNKDIIKLRKSLCKTPLLTDDEVFGSDNNIHIIISAEKE